MHIHTSQLFPSYMFHLIVSPFKQKGTAKSFLVSDFTVPGYLQLFQFITGFHPKLYVGVYATI
mgnify:CR=1 FL=1